MGRQHKGERRNEKRKVRIPNCPNSRQCDDSRPMPSKMHQNSTREVNETMQKHHEQLRQETIHRTLDELRAQACSPVLLVMGEEGAERGVFVGVTRKKGKRAVTQMVQTIRRATERVKVCGKQFVRRSPILRNAPTRSPQPNTREHRKE
jgi:hypothetical protein